MKGPRLRARIRYPAARIVTLVESWVLRGVVAAARLALRVAPMVLVAIATWLVLMQPAPDPITHDALIGIAGILATVLSLGLTVTLLVAQHTAERHARVLYVEFRRERAWRLVLGFLGLGVSAVGGKEAQEMIAQIFTASKAVVDRAREVIK